MGTKSLQKTSEIQELNLNKLKQGIGCISSITGEFLCEVSSVCLENRHNPGVLLKVDGNYHKEFFLVWDKTTLHMQQSWKERKVKAEWGAIGIAFLLIEKLTEYTIAEQSVIGTGFDYWLDFKGNRDANVLFQKKARLEVSGIMEDKIPRLKSRTTQKQEQINRSSEALPAFVIVTEFSEPRSRMVKK